LINNKKSLVKGINYSLLKFEAQHTVLDELFKNTENEKGQ